MKVNTKELSALNSLKLKRNELQLIISKSELVIDSYMNKLTNIGRLYDFLSVGSWFSLVIGLPAIFIEIPIISVLALALLLINLLLASFAYYYSAYCHKIIADQRNTIMSAIRKTVGSHNEKI